MTQLLISVKNSEEAMLALSAGVDMIDLKDPNVGALGALDLEISKDIIDVVNGQAVVSATVGESHASVSELLIEIKLRADIGVDIIDLKNPNIGALGALNLAETKEIIDLVNGRTLVSATVGEQHANLSALVADIQIRAQIGVDIIKIAVSDLFQTTDLLDEIFILYKSGIKIIAVFFADEVVDLTWLCKLKNAGFYGAMLDTQNKQHHLMQVQPKEALHVFSQKCHQYQLISGLAGSLQPQHIDLLTEINPTYIGFRGGVCENSHRKSHLDETKLMQVQNMLRNGNKNRINAQLILGLALHS